MSYIVVRNRDPKDFENDVTHKLSQGYELVGSTFIVQGELYAKGYNIPSYYQGTPEIAQTFCQAMIKTNKKTVI